MGAWKTLMLNFSSDAQSLPIFSDTGWHHYAIVFDEGQGTASMYWDGRPQGTLYQYINSFLAKTTQIGSSSPTNTTATSAAPAAATACANPPVFGSRLDLRP